MDPNTLIDITDLAWQDVQTAGTGTELGVVVLVLSRDGNEGVIQTAGTVPPEVVRYVLERALANLQDERFEFFHRGRKQAV